MKQEKKFFKGLGLETTDDLLSQLKADIDKNRKSNQKWQRVRGVSKKHHIQYEKVNKSIPEVKAIAKSVRGDAYLDTKKYIVRPDGPIKCIQSSLIDRQSPGKYIREKSPVDDDDEPSP